MTLRCRHLQPFVGCLRRPTTIERGRFRAQVLRIARKTPDAILVAREHALRRSSLPTD